MARATDTRTRVRELADSLAAQGETPTPSIIRALLGRGSPNTIVDELKAWARDRQNPGTTALSEAPDADSRRGASIVQLRRLESQIQALTSEISALQKLQTGWLEALPALGGAPAPASEIRACSASEDLKALAARFDGMQKYMLRQIDEAREQAVKWQHKYQSVKSEFGDWQTAVRQKIDALQTENVWLKGRLNEPAKPMSSFNVETTANGGGKVPAYSGNPKAATFHDDE